VRSDTCGTLGAPPPKIMNERSSVDCCCGSTGAGRQILTGLYVPVNRGSNPLPRTILKLRQLFLRQSQRRLLSMPTGLMGEASYKSMGVDSNLRCNGYRRRGKFTSRFLAGFDLSICEAVNAALNLSASKKMRP
jgi:hypothetical protein